MPVLQGVGVGFETLTPKTDGIVRSPHLLKGFGKALVQSVYVRQQAAPWISMQNSDDLATLKDLAEAGEISPVIDKVYPLDDGAEAMAHVSGGHTQGKTVITILGGSSAEKEAE